MALYPEENRSVFQQLKRVYSIRPSYDVPPKVFLQLGFDPAGAYLDVVDEKGKRVEYIDHRPYHGALRDVLRLVESLRAQAEFTILWDERSSDRLYLADHDVLLWPLRQCDNFVDEALQPIRFVEGLSEPVLTLGPAPNTTPEVALLESRLTLRHDGAILSAPRYVTERYWLSQGGLYETMPLGTYAASLPLFETVFAADTLTQFLSLLFTHVPQVRLEYPGYRVVEGTPCEARPTLFFEKIDENKTLYLRVASSVSGVDPNLFIDYELTVLVQLNEVEQTLVRRPLVYQELATPMGDIRKRLRGTRRKLEEDAEADIHYLEEGDLFIIGADLAQAFIQQHLSDLVGHYALYGAERLASYKIRTVKPLLNLSLQHGLDFLEGQASLSVDGETFSLFDAIHQYRKQGYLALSDGTQALVDRAYIDRMERLFQRKKGDQIRVSFFDLPLIEELIEERRGEVELPQVREVFQGFNTLHEQALDLPPLQATLRPYQEFGYRWLTYLHEHQLGGCLADEMGLGKTIQTITLLASFYSTNPPENPTLVVLPRSLLYNWANELDRFAPQLTHHTYYGTERNLEAALQSQVILTTYDIVRNDIETLKDQPFYYVILDESQRIKNVNSQISKAATILQAQHRLALSGTPIQNNLGELYALFRFLNPAMFGSVQAFAKDYAQPIQREQDADVAHELRKKIYPFVLRRLKRDVAKDLPERIDQTLIVEMTPEQQRFYEQRRLFYKQAITGRIQTDGIQRSQFFIFQALNELRQIASVPEALTEGRILSAKREMLLEQVQEVIANRRKVLIFVNFLQAIENIGEDLAQAGIEYLTMTGATQHRQKLVDQFQGDDAVKAFLMTLKTGSLGLNLTAADTVFLYDPWWNQAAEDQAIDRTHRIGQEKTVFSYKLIAQGTIEEKILQLQDHKRALFDQIIASDQASLKTLTEEDIDFILMDS